MTTAIASTVPLTNATPSTATALADAAPARTRRAWTAAEKAHQCLSLYRESGMSQADFAREMKMSPATLSLWLRQQRDGVTGTPADEDGPLIEVPMPPPRDAASTIGGTVMIHLPGGVRLEVVAGTDVAWLGKLLGNLQPCSA